MANVVITTPGSGTFTVPSGVTSITVDCYGPGGQGYVHQGMGGALYSGRSGGGGGWGRKTFAVSPGQSISYTVGAGGSTTATTFSTLSAGYGLHALDHGYGGGYSGADTGAAGTQGADTGGLGGNSGGYPSNGGGAGVAIGVGGFPGGGGGGHKDGGYPGKIGGGGQIAITYASDPPVATVDATIPGPVFYGLGEEIEITDVATVASVAATLNGPVAAVRASHRNYTLQEHLVGLGQTPAASYTCPVTGRVGPPWSMVWVGSTGGWSVNYVDGGFFIDNIMAAARTMSAPVVEGWSTSNETANNVRAERDRLLAASDRTQLVDAPLTPEIRAAWATYRNALRNLPQQYADPSEIVWPNPPS